MPKPKLSKDQKTALRGEIQGMLKKGARQSAVMAALAPKYKISGQTVRYYVGQMNGSPRKKRRKSATRPALRKALADVAELSDQDVKRLLEGRKLQGQLAGLQERRKKTKHELRSIEVGIKKIRKRIARVVR